MLIRGSFRPLQSLLGCRSVATARPGVVLACNLYVSEGRDAALISRLESQARALPNTILANVFIDEPYNRSNFTLLSRCPDSLAAAAVTVARMAASSVDLSSHTATHPRLGAVDHISCHPLVQGQLKDAVGDDLKHVTAAAEEEGEATMAAAKAAARSVAVQLGEGNEQHAPIPTYLYGAAHPQNIKLADIRRKLGYFLPAASPTNEDGQWSGALPFVADKPLPLPPDLGPPVAHPSTGVICVGAVPWVVNFNVLLDSTDLTACKTIAKVVSERAGGVGGVQSMALLHKDGIEIACNVVNPHRVDTNTVEAEIAQAAAAHGIQVRTSYRVGKSVQELMKMAERMGTESQQPNKDRTRQCLVYNLDPTMDWRQLRQVFQENDHNVIYAQVFFTKSGVSKCWGFLKFETIEEVQNAIKSMDNFMVNGRRLRVVQDEVASHTDPSQQSFDRGHGSCFVYNLDNSIDSEELRQIFEDKDYSVVWARVFNDMGISKCCGCVKFATIEEAQHAIKTMDKFVVNGRKMGVVQDEFDRKVKRKPRKAPIDNAFAEEPGERVGVTQIQVTGLPPFKMDTVRRFFQDCGDIVEIHTVMGRGGSEGHTTVTFANKEGAEAAIRMYDGVPVHGRYLNVRFA